MHLVVFDVDGTLADTAPVDMECFWQSRQGNLWAAARLSHLV